MAEVSKEAKLVLIRYTDGTNFRLEDLAAKQFVHEMHETMQVPVEGLFITCWDCNNIILATQAIRDLRVNRKQWICVDRVSCKDYDIKHNF